MSKYAVTESDTIEPPDSESEWDLRAMSVRHEQSGTGDDRREEAIYTCAWQRLGSSERRTLVEISAIRDSIVGSQSVNWSEHIYPLVAALDKAGFKGAGYEISRKNYGTLIEHLSRAEAERDMLRDCEQEGACATPPGCVRHWVERNGELVVERDALRSVEPRAEGYAEAVADVVALLEEQMRGLAIMPKAKHVYVRSLLNLLKIGTHVGAAKKGVGK